MSTLKTTNLQHEASANPNIVLDNTGGATFVQNITLGTVGGSDQTLRLNSDGNGYLELSAEGSVNKLISGNAATGSANLAFEVSSGGVEFEAARIDSSGRLLIGTDSGTEARSNNVALQIVGTDFSTSSAMLRRSQNSTGGPSLIFAASNGTIASPTIVAEDDKLGGIRFYGYDGTGFEGFGAEISSFVDNTPGANDMPGRLVFSTTTDGANDPTEAMRITARQSVLMGVEDESLEIGDDGVVFVPSASYTAAHRIAKSVSAGAITLGIFGGVGQAYVRGDGDLENTNNRYTGISDIKFKQNIEDSESQWNDIKAVRVRKYELIQYPERRHIGVVAQELEQTSPGLVIEREDQDTGESYKTVAYSVLYMKAVKALQEAMTRIETLEASNTDLLARISVLEQPSSGHS